MKIPDEILEVLRACATCDGNELRLGGERLHPRLYRRTNEVLEGAGGKWDKRHQAHIFPGLAESTLAQLLETGEVTTVRERVQHQQYFPTPPTVMTRLMDLSGARDGMEVLEPSAGRGAIVSALVERGCLVDAVEREPEHAQILKESGAARTVMVADFLSVPAEPSYDRVVMNPPFTGRADVAHVRHALGFLRPSGVLVSVMPQGVETRTDAAGFRRLVADRGGSFEALPDGAFTESGTGVRTVIVTIPAGPSTGSDTKVTSPQADEALSSSVDEGEAFPSPLAILAEIRREMRAADRAIKDLEAMLSPSLSALATQHDQLAIDLFSEGGEFR